jgi:DNA-directed RNA polymerase subunit H
VRKPAVRRKKAKEDEVPPFQISTHFLIPKHELLTREESQQILAKFNGKPGQFPYILATDPLAKEIGAKPGDFVRITRRSETAGSSMYYRYVVEGGA